jgi:hypothetical protein
MKSCGKFCGKLFAPILVSLTLLAAESHAQSGVQVDAVQKQLTQLYQTAKATADGTDLVTAGSVLVLQKDHLLMNKVDQPYATPNVYKNGTIGGNGAGAVNVIKAFNGLGKLNPFANQTGMQSATDAAGATREFVAGEKFWVTRIDTRPDAVAFTLLSDPIKDQRYHAVLTFPLAKGGASPDDVTSLVSEVLKIDDSSQGQSADQGGQSQGGQQQAAAAPAAPAVATKTIAVGQTRDQVIAMFGVPGKIVQLGTKEIDVFQDMKVTFVQNKVVDVQ